MLIYNCHGIRVFAKPIEGDKSVRERFRTERLAVAQLLNEAFPEKTPELLHHPSGAPYLTEDVEISVSHSRTMAVVALAPEGTQIGIDTETIDRSQQLSRIAARFLSPEQMSVWGLSAESMLRAWTVKEALYKAVGKEGWPLMEIPLPVSPDQCEVNVFGHSFSVTDITGWDTQSLITMVVNHK